MRHLANAIQAQLDTLVDQYDARLQTMPGYADFPATARRDLERQMLKLMARCLEAGDSHELVQYSRQRAIQWAGQGLDLTWFQQALVVPEEILIPLIDSVEASTFLWQALNRSQAAVWQLVAERTRTVEQNLRQSQQLLQTVMDNIPQAVFWKDQSLTYLGCNRAFADDAALASPAQIVGKTDYDMPWQPQADLYRADDQLVIDSGTAKINYEEPQTTPTGGQTWLRTSKVPMRDAAGKVTAVLGMYEDVTDRKRAEEALARERNLLRTLIDNVPDQIFFKDTQGRIILYNQADARAMGIASTEEAVGKTVYDLYPTELAERFHSDDMAVIQSGQPLIEREEPGVDTAGQPRWVLATKVPLTDAQGNRLGLVGVARDITGRKQTEAILRQSEERFRRFSEATLEGLVFHDEGVILDVNPAVVKLFGYTAADDLVGRNLLEFIVPDLRGLVVQKMRLDDVHPYEIQCIRQNGDIFPVETSTRVYQYGERTIRASSVRDITERKKLEQSIRDSLERRGRQVEVSRQVAQEIAAAPELSDLFQRVVTLTKERFDYYHTQIFRYDAARDAVVLVASYGEAGRKLLAAGHGLPMGSGVVGTAAATGRSILAADVTQDLDWHPNPDLPGAKGELAVPIKLRDQVLGILDVQSDRAGALTDDDRLLVEGLCGQIATAMESTRLLNELRANEAQLADALRVAHLANWEYNVPGDTFTFNDQFYALMRTTAEREGGYSLSSAQYTQRFVHPDDAALVGREIGKALETTDPGYRGQVDHRVYFGDGELGYITVRFSIEKDAQGRTIRTRGANQDITERKLAEEIIRRNEAELSDALKIAKLAYWDYDVAQDLFHFNDQFYSIFHTTAEQHGGYQLPSAYYAQHFVHPDDLPVVGAEIENALNSTDRHYSRLLEHRILYGGGGVGYISVSINIDRDEKGRILRYYGANQDITDRKLAEVALTEEHTRLRTLIDNLPVSVYIKDRDSRFVVNNAVHLRILGAASQEEVSGKWDFDYFPQELAEQYYADEQELMRIGQPLFNREESVVNQSSGQQHWALSTKVPLRDIHGQVTGFLGFTQDITERKLAEEAVRRSQADLSQALQIARLAYWEYDVARDLFHFNDQFYAIFHTTAEQQGGYQLSSAQYAQRFVYPDDLPVVGAEIEKALNSTDRHYSRQLDHRIQYADGGIGYISVSINIDRDEQGHILRYYGANQDITASKLAEEAVRRSEAELSEALQIARLAYWEYDVERDLFTFNDQFYTLFHTTAAQHGGYQLPSAYYAEHFVHPDDRGLVGAEIGRSLSSTDRHYNRLLEHRIIYADGTLGHISVNINIDRDEQGKILRVYGANQDITERKRAEVELKETEERFRIIAETTPVPILISGAADGIVLYGNDQLGQMFGMPIAGLIGRQSPDFYVDPDARQRLLDQLRRDGFLRDYEVHVRRVDGTPFWVMISMRPLVFANQHALFAAFIDITSSRQAAEDLRRSEAQLSEALKTARLAYWELDLARQKFIFNDQLYALLHTTTEAEGGYEMDINAYVQRFIYPEDIPYVGATIAQGLQNPDPNVSTQLEARVVCADGEVRWLATQVSNKMNEAGQPFKAVGTNQDITERKQAEAEREQLLTEQRKRALQLQTASEVSRATSSILNLDELLPQAAELVRARFSLYYVGIFLSDEPERWAVLRAGTGDAGRQMLADGHKLKIGGASMISRCIVTQQAQIALDVGEGAVRFENPQLPLTRSELALPLISRGHIMGAVTIQSDQPAAFRADDVTVLQTMADQIGNAIENARLYEQSSAALLEVDALNRRLTGEGWETYLRRGSSQQVIWASDNEAIAPAPLTAADEQLSAGQIVVEPADGDEQQTMVSVPVMLRGQAIGALRVTMPQAAYTNELRVTLESLAGHVAQSAENARLLDETQARFARERALTEATDKIRSRTEVNRILEAAAAELAHYLHASAINVRLGSSVAATGETGQPG